MRNLIKNFLYFIFYLINFFNKKRRIFVLMYHSVGNGEWNLVVDKKEFAKQICYLKKNFCIIGLDKIVSFIKREIDLPDKTVAISFDDGFKDTYTEVFPLVKEKRIPITIFLTTDQDNDERYKKLKNRNVDRPSWGELLKMKKSGLVSFGAHGHKHLNLLEITDDEVKLNEEVDENIKLIQEKLSLNPRFFAYAYGCKNDKIKEFIKKKGFEAAFSITEGIVEKGSDLFQIKRVQVDKTMNFCLFKMRLSGALDLNRKFVDFMRKLWKKNQ